MKKILAIILFCSPIFSQVELDKNGGSIYSIFGLGDLNYSTSTRTDAMGILGLGLYGNYSNSMNPAAWSKISSTRFSTQFNYLGIKSTDGISTAKRNYGNFEGFNLSILANRNNGWVINLGFNNYSTVNYDVKSSGIVGGESFTQYYSGNGGISRVNVGFSYNLSKSLSFGTQFNYAFGTFAKTVQIDFSNNELFDSKQRISESVSGFYFNSGLVFHGFDKLFKSKKLNNMALGLYFASPFKLKSSFTGIYERRSENDTVDYKNGNINVPLSFGAGVSNVFNNRLIVATDFLMQLWDNYKYYGAHPVEIKNSMRLGFGIEFTESKKPEASFFKRVSYRLGANYTSDYLKLLGQSINAWSVNAGFMIPLSRMNTMDLVVSYITRGKSTNGLIKDEMLRVGATINIGEFWFLKSGDDF